MLPNTADLINKIFSGSDLTDDEVYSLLALPSDELREAAAAVHSKFSPRKFDSCSIINARSGLCSENCKWCAQSRHYSTDCEQYAIVDHDQCLDEARQSHKHGIGRFSMVASGRSVSGKALDSMCAMLSEIKSGVGIATCASMGLLSYEEMKKLREAGVMRYHCNLETAPSHFPTLCSTHTYDDKLQTIAHAHSLGMEVCSGGIIGMGESARQRAEFALALRRAKPVSIPINVLIPIPGTPLADTPAISDDEIIDTVAIFRLTHPRTTLRFAGGRKRLSTEVQLQCMRVGINGAIVGDMLTTIGNSVAEDRKLVTKADYEF